jgi:adenylate cyclase
MSSPTSQCYAFDRYRLDPLRGRLLNGTDAVELRPKSLAVLHHLVTHPQRLVSKEELLEAVWGKVVVTEDSLVQCVREIRRALSDDDQRLIRTIPRSGYIFTADVVEEGAVPFLQTTSAALPRGTPAMRRRWLIGAALAVLGAIAVFWLGVASRHTTDATGSSAARSQLAANPRLSIAVLPLANIGNDPAQEYFADGLTHDLTTDLSRIPASLVISRNSTASYKGRPTDIKTIGRELGARYVLEGSVQRLNGNVRVNLRLVDSDSGAQLWAERFEGPRGNLPRMQTDIVARIAQTLQVQLFEAEADRGLRERSANPDAYDLFMRGAALWERRQASDNAKARQFFSQALTLDPQFSLAWVGLANTHLSDLHSGWSEDRHQSLQQAEKALDRAYAVGPRHRDVNAARGTLLFWQGKNELALAAFDNEIELNPSNALAHVWRGLMLISLGRPAEAIPSVERGLLLSPRDGQLNIFYRGIAHANFSLGRFGDAVTWSEKAVSHTPQYTKGYAFLAAAAALHGDNAKAKSALNEFQRLQPRYKSISAFRSSMMPGELRMFDATPKFWNALRNANLPE